MLLIYFYSSFKVVGKVRVLFVYILLQIQRLKIEEDTEIESVNRILYIGKRLLVI